MNFKYKLKNEDFDIAKILESGQNLIYNTDNSIYSFNYNNIEINAYTQKEDTYFSIDKTFFDSYLYDFFDLDTDYANIRREINTKFPELKQYTDYGKGIRFLKQDFLQVCITFIISQNNNIKRILQSVDLLKEKFDCQFPTLIQLKTMSIEDLRKLGVGFRDKYLYDFIQKIDEKWIKKMQSMNTQDAFNELVSFYGIGPKVANCILLFGLNKRDVFPVDTHIKSIMQDLYFNAEDTDVKNIEKFALNKFGNLASYIQQYLFYWEIQHK